MDRLATAIADVATTTATLHALLALELDRRGVLPKAEFADLLRRQLKALEDNPPASYDGGPRSGLKMIQAVVGFLEGPPPKGWTPVVIKGGKG